MIKHIVKRNHQVEAFDSRKIYASVYAACLSVHETPTTAELIAEHVSDDIKRWIDDKNEVTANDIRAIAAKLLSEINPQAGFVYRHHRIMW